MINLEDIMGEMKKMKSSLQEMEEKTKHLQVTSEAGAGLVKATIKGNKQLVNIQIDESILHPAEKTMLQDLIVAAVNRALADLQIKTKQELGQVMGLPSFLQDLLQ